MRSQVTKRLIFNFLKSRLVAGWLGSTMYCIVVCFCAGFFTDDLTIHNDIAGGGGKYLGVCQLPGEGRKVRVQAITMK